MYHMNQTISSPPPPVFTKPKAQTETELKIELDILSKLEFKLVIK